ncbi:4a-hydroxytetrahydrobiopterin dehydratase [Nocardioides sp. InS609-2]|uniref:4a-hydroxytetrahydrobiopterin dehydratase n=1 Tax=Nocardioides sp. InS609-2 TaxID=2760705 RepID=UPI0017C3B8C7|nr:4a-hydroxytetrahydrobiopterin dehydratase [Nocardioides sp. InS609-2]MBA3783234.1 4a-hydroxytetrahydrobiopterin dehydratase [Nocardioides sp.]
MSDDPKQKLSHDDVLAAGLDDWRKILNSLAARFLTGDFATGLALVDRIGAAAEEAGHHPDITLTYPSVAVTLSSHDVGGLTSRDIDLARLISSYAAEAGVQSDPASLTRVELGLDAADGERLVPFWAALTGAEAKQGEALDPTGQVPTIWFQGIDLDHERAEGEVEQRFHLDVWVPHDQAEQRLQAVLDAGGSLVSDAEAPAFWVVADADGNRSCICTPLSR